MSDWIDQMAGVGVVPVAFESPQNDLVTEIPFAVKWPVTHVGKAQADAPYPAMNRLDQLYRSRVVLAADINAGQIVVVG